MARRVPRVPPSLVATDVINGRTVRGPTWQAIAGMYNWLSGRGCVLVPSYCPGVDIAAGTTRTFRFNAYRRATGLSRVWFVTGTSIAGAGHSSIAAVTATAPTGGAFSSTNAFRLSTSGRYDALMVHEAVATPGSTEGEISIDIAVAASLQAFALRGIACFEAPRFLLASSESSADVESVRPGQPIAAITGSSVSFLQSVTTSLAKRNGVYQWAVPEADARSSTSTSFANLFLLSPTAIARKLFTGLTAGTLNWRVWARAVTQNGEVRVTTTRTGNTNTITVTAGAGWGWWPAAGSNAFTIDCENLSAADGLQSATNDDLDIELRTAAGGGTLEVASVSIGEG